MPQEGFKRTLTTILSADADGSSRTFLFGHGSREYWAPGEAIGQGFDVGKHMR